MNPKITIDNNAQPVHAYGYRIRTLDREMDVYLMGRPDGRPYLVVVGEPDDKHGWDWRGYEVVGLVDPDDDAYRGLTPHEAIVHAAVKMFLEDERRTRAA